MKAHICGLLITGAICLAALAMAQDVTAAMQGPLAAQVKQGCNTELTKYCAEVTPGEGRLLACLYAYGDKLSGQCEYALYDAAARLERAVNTIAYVADQCRNDIESKCANIQPGQGRIAKCLVDHKSSLTQPCAQALADAGVK
jgi:cysteine rich repeat protein